MLIDPQTGRVRVDGWPKGVDNRSEDTDVVEGAARDAVNVDILKSGKVRSRSGITARIASPNSHSVFATDKYMVWATNDAMYVSTDGVTGTKVLSNTQLGTPISYVEVNGEIYWSNEYVNGKINAAGLYEKWGIDVPYTAFTLLGSSVAAGELPRKYQVTCTFVTATGEESGSGDVVQVTCGDFPQISVFNIPQSSDSRVVATRLYVTNIDGSIFYSAQDVPAGITSTVLNGFFADGAQLKTMFMGPPPPGQLLDYLNGKIYIASGNVVWITNPLRYGVVDTSAGYYMWSDRVTMVKAVPEGFFVSADKTYYIAETSANPVEAKQTILFEHKAVEGAACSLPDSTDVVWFSEYGFVRGTAGGRAELLTVSQLAVDAYTRGTMAYSQINGHKAITAMLQGGVANSEINSDYVAAEAIRRSELR